MKKVVVVALALSLAACVGSDNPRINPGAMIGFAVGAATGGLIGAQFGGGLGQALFIASGTIVGGASGYTVAQYLEQSDWTLYDDTAREALSTSPDGSMQNWSNPKTGASGVIRPTRSFRTQTGMYCRNYRSTVAVSRGVQSGDGTACLSPDGDWYAMRDEIS